MYEDVTIEIETEKSLHYIRVRLYLIDMSYDHERLPYWQYDNMLLLQWNEIPADELSIESRCLAEEYIEKRFTPVELAEMAIDTANKAEYNG